MFLCPRAQGDARPPEAGRPTAPGCERADGLHSRRGGEEDGGRQSAATTAASAAIAAAATATVARGERGRARADNRELPRRRGSLRGGQRGHVLAQAGKAARGQAGEIVSFSGVAGEGTRAKRNNWDGSPLPWPYCYYYCTLLKTNTNKCCDYLFHEW